MTCLKFILSYNEFIDHLVNSEVAQLCLTLCDHMDCNLQGFSVHEIFQAIVLEWIAISFSRGSSQPRDQTWVSHIVDRRFTVWATRYAGCSWDGGIILGELAFCLQRLVLGLDSAVGYQHSWNLERWESCLSRCNLSKITADGDCSHEIKRHLLLGSKVMSNLDSIFKSRDITLPTKVRLVKAMVFPVVMYGCESWTVKKAERRRIDAFELWCWRRLFFFF